MTEEVRIPIRNDSDIVAARKVGREMASQIGFSGSDLTVIATAISEVVRNIVVYAGAGELVLSPAQQGGRQGILIVAQDQGPGIADIEMAMMDGFSTGGSLGLGLPGSKRLMDDFGIESKLGEGTKVTMKKWKR